MHGEQSIMNQKFFLYNLFVILLLLISITTLFSDPGSNSKTEGDTLLESKRYSDAEKYALSILKNTPSDPKAEFVLAKAWIGLGLEEKKKGNRNKAVEYFEKAQEKWPLNEEVRSELVKLRSKENTTSSKSVIDPNASKTVEALQSDLEALRTEIQNDRASLSRWAIVFAVLFVIQGIGSVFLFMKVKGRGN